MKEICEKHENTRDFPSSVIFTDRKTIFFLQKGPGRSVLNSSLEL